MASKLTKMAEEKVFENNVKILHWKISVPSVERRECSESGRRTRRMASSVKVI